jgi:uncharacterized protein
MKPSFYNIFIPLEEGSYILHNKLTGALMTIDEETKEILDSMREREEDMPEDLVHLFKENGIIIEEDEDELLRIRHRYKAVCYDPQTIAFVLAPTARCNLSCCYCVQRVDESLVDKSAYTATMLESTMKRALSFVKTMTETCNVKRLPVSIYGGEPLMARQTVLNIFEDLNKWCKERSYDFITSMTTNLTLMDESFLDDIQQYSPLYIRTTFDGPEKIHNLYRHYKNGEGTYQKIVTNMGMLNDAGITVRVQINVNKHYLHVPELFDDLKERGLTNIVMEVYALVDPFVTIPEAQKYYGVLDESFPLPESQFAIPFRKMSEAKAFVYHAAYEKGFILPPSQLGIWTPCDGMRAYNFLVDPSGDVYKCVGSMLIKNLRVGRILEDGSLERYPFFYKWMNTDPTLIERCQTCHLLPSCGGGCIVGRMLGNIPCFCEVSHFPGEEYIKMGLKQEYSQQLQSLKIG